jgi:hypothetical protein
MIIQNSSMAFKSRINSQWEKIGKWQQKECQSEDSDEYDWIE